MTGGRLGARKITLVIALLSAVMFGTTAYQQFAALTPAPAGRLFWGLLFASLGYGAVWFIYLVLRGIRKLYTSISSRR